MIGINMAKSLKKFLKVGDTVITPNLEMYKVTQLEERAFICIKPLMSYHQTFYYNIEMTILREVAKNY